MAAAEDYVEWLDRLATQRFQAGLLEIQRTFRTESPYLTGQLAEGVQVVERDESNYTAVISSTARSPQGADYGSILEAGTGGKIIRPKVAKALAWSDANGDFVRAWVRGTDKHKGWFSDIVATWPQIIRDVRI